MGQEVRGDSAGPCMAPWPVLKHPALFHLVPPISGQGKCRELIALARAPLWAQHHQPRLLAPPIDQGRKAEEGRHRSTDPSTAPWLVRSASSGRHHHSGARGHLQVGASGVLQAAAGRSNGLGGLSPVHGL